MDNALSFYLEADEIDIFLQDVNEHIHVIETGILLMEHSADSETLNAIFRAAHTLKAVAATVGHQPMAELTHTMETLFDMLRTGDTLPSLDVVDRILTSVDILKALRDEVVTLQPSGVDVTSMIRFLHQLIDSSAQRKLMSSTQVEEKRGQLTLTTAQMAHCEEYESQNYELFKVHAQAEIDAFAPAARLLQALMALQEVGEIIAQTPTETELVNDRHDNAIEAIIATELEKADVRELLEEISDLATVAVTEYSAAETAAQSALIPQNEADDEAGKDETLPVVVGIEGSKTVRINVERLDTLMNLVGELITNRTHLTQITEELNQEYGKHQGLGMLAEVTTRFNRVVDQLQQEVMQARMLPISSLFKKFPRLVHDVARRANKQVDLVMQGKTTELDRSVIELVGDPLIHLLRNAVDHGIEPPEVREKAGKARSGTLWLTASQAEGHIVLTVQDDGMGINVTRVRQEAVKRGLMTQEEVAQLDDSQTFDLLFRPNMSTAEKVTGVSGRGVGLDVVHTNIKKLGGTIFVESQIGTGTTFRITLPLTLAILQAMLVNLGGNIYAIPLTDIVESLYVSDLTINTVKGHPMIYRRGQTLPLIYLRDFFKCTDSDATLNVEHKPAIVTVAWGKQHVGLVVDRLIGKQEIVVKSLGSIVGNIPGLSSCTILGNGYVALIIDIPGLIGSAMRSRR